MVRSRKWETGCSRPPISRKLCPLLFWLRFYIRGLGGLATAKLLRRLHKHLRILLQPFLNTRVGFQKLLKLGMICLEFLAVGQPGIVGKLLRESRMTAEEFTEVINIPAGRLVIAVVLDPVEVLFLPHETVWVLGDLLAYSRVLLQILLQRRMFLDKFFVLHQRGVSAQLLADFRMTVGKTIDALQFPTSRVVVPPSLTPIEALFLPHKSVWVLGYLLAGPRMLLQIFLQSGMVLDKFVVRHQRGISAKLLGDFRMAVHEAIKARQLTTSRVVVAPVVIPPVFAPIEALFLPHETVRVLGYFLSYSGMLLQILLQCGMVLDKLLVRNQRRISAQLLGHFGMAVHKAIKARNLSTGRVVVLRDGLCTTLGRKLCTRGD